MATFERDHETRGPGARDTQDPHATLYGQPVSLKVTQGRYAPKTGEQTAAAIPAPPQWVGAAMPWVLSLFFHIGVAMILAFVMVISVVTPPPQAELTIVNDPMAPQRDGPVVPQTTLLPGVDNELAKGRDMFRPLTDLRNPTTDHELIVKGQPGPITSLLPTGSTGLSPTKSAGGGMFERGIVGGQSRAGNVRPQRLDAVNNMIFVIDRSGSMISDLPPLKHELKKTVRLLKSDQRFALVLFTSGEPREFVQGKLVQANQDYKGQFFEYVNAIEAAGRTDPMPTLRRAFALAKSAPKTEYTAICLLSDGIFPDVDAAVHFVGQATKGTNIHVFTYLYGEQNKEAENMMKRIAHEGNGSYNSVTRE